MKKLTLIFTFFMIGLKIFCALELNNSRGKFLIDPDSLSVIWKCTEEEITLSEPQPFFKADIISQEKDSISIMRDKILIKFTVAEDHLDIQGKSDTGSFTFPIIGSDVEEFIFPLKGGKRIPAEDKIWTKYLEEKLDEVQGSSIFSMNFFAFKERNSYPTYIFDNRYHNRLNYKNKIFTFTHDFTKLSKEKEIVFKIYPSTGSISESAKIYRNLLIKNGEFTTLKNKAVDNKNIEKLLGAPHFYIAGEVFFSKNDVKDFNKFFLQLKNKLKDKNSFIYKLVVKNSLASEELKKLFTDIDNSESINNYHKNSLVRILNEILYSNSFSQNTHFGHVQDIKKKFALEFKNQMLPPEKWGEGASLEVLENLKSLGIDRAWLGFHNYNMGEINPEFVEMAFKSNYLIGAYDSYKSIHRDGKEGWNTAAFKDKTLFEKATISDMSGKKITGFNGIGRELNPKFSFEEVNYRLKRFTRLNFNSWFIDTDAVGEVHDDYTQGNESDESEQIQERLKRMKVIRDKYNMVIGSEDGDDFSASVIAFSHGMFTGIVPWWKFKEMKDPNSEYFMGKYVSRDGGVPEYFEKQIKLPFEADYLFYDERFNLPLYQLIYNDSVIGTHHWIFDTLKIKDRQTDVMLREILYNVPPMYHLDRNTLREKGDIILKHFKDFSQLHRKLAFEEMTDFKYLTDDKLVQRTSFSDGTKIIVNFSNKPYSNGKYSLKGKSFQVIK